MYRRNKGNFYLEDILTGKQQSLRTKQEAKAKRLLAGKNQSVEQPQMNLAMARVYLASKSPELMSRTWDDVMRDMEAGYQDGTKIRWQKMMRCAPFQIIRNLPLLYTESAHFLAVLRHPKAGTSTNKWLRIMHNRAMDLGWLLSPVLVRRAWPKILTKRMQAITYDQHCQLVAKEHEPEFKLYLQMLWETGGSQTDIACLQRDNIDADQKRITYRRKKLQTQLFHGAAIVIGPNIQHLLDQLPKEGFLFPRLRLQPEGIRASRFAKQCRKLKITGVSLHISGYDPSLRLRRGQSAGDRAWFAWLDGQRNFAFLHKIVFRFRLKWNCARNDSDSIDSH
ncbi:MAG: hypothetical protein B9S32_01040 [Verrucomicrobia bacterium Tous-C9LFEB]|nr:MAG: hypothetical protein B9S32_01040 [Verrucomicrobia bacterium Tous-C9LFEB]